MGKIRVLVTDGETLFREGICALLKIRDDMEVVGEAADGDETLEMLTEHQPDVLVMNVNRPGIDGTEVCQRIRKKHSGVRILLVSQYEDGERLIRGLEAGADGYLLRRAATSELVSAILSVHRGDFFLYPAVARTIVEDYRNLTKHPSPDPYDRLTSEEREILKLTVQGSSIREISDLMKVSTKMATGRRAGAMRKLGIHSQVELIKYAIRRHLVDLS